MIPAMPVSIHAHPPRGCHECEMQRLMKWAATRGLIDSFTGPFETVNRLIRLVDNMERTLHSKDARIEELHRELTMIKSARDFINSFPGEASVAVGQLSKESQ